MIEWIALLAAANGSSSEAQLRTANDREVAAFLAADTKALAPLWSSDFLVTNPLNKVAGKNEVLGMVTSGLLLFKSYRRTIENIRFYRDIAVVVGSEDVEWAGKFPLA